MAVIQPVTVKVNFSVRDEASTPLDEIAQRGAEIVARKWLRENGLIFGSPEDQQRRVESLAGLLRRAMSIP